jgi:predicted DCC family thiol-disulfide oxidoreductase YuxK
MNERWFIVYDAECPFCRAQVADIKEHDTNRAFEFIPNEAALLFYKFPQLKDKDLNSTVWVVAPDGKLYCGAEAVYQIMRQLKFYRHIAWLYRMPILHGLAEKTYKWVSLHRYKL